jgi:hypothetical protein
VTRTCLAINPVVRHLQFDGFCATHAVLIYIHKRMKGWLHSLEGHTVLMHSFCVVMTNVVNMFGWQ